MSREIGKTQKSNIYFDGIKAFMTVYSGASSLLVPPCSSIQNNRGGKCELEQFNFAVATFHWQYIDSFGLTLNLAKKKYSL